MTLSRNQKIVLGIFTLVPFIMVPYIIYEVFNFVIETVKASEHSEPEPTVVIGAILSFLMPILLLSTLSLVLLILYIIHAVSNAAINNTEKLIWILFFIFFGIVAFPVYWFLRIEQEQYPDKPVTNV